MPYGITQCRGDIPVFIPAKMVLDIAILKGCKAELI